MEKEYKTLGQIQRACRKITSCATQTDDYMSKCFPFICEKLESIDEGLKTLSKVAKQLTVLEKVKELLDSLE